MRMRAGTTAALMLMTFAVTASRPSPAAAAGPATAPGKTTDEADALFNKGAAAFDAGKPEQAYELYLAAWKLKQTHDIAGNLAQVELALGKKRDAAEHIAFALAHFPPTVKSERREGMSKVLDGLRKDLGVLRIHVSVADARVALDRMPIGLAPLSDEVFVDPGAHVIEATLKGYKLARAQVDAAKGSAQDVTLTLDGLSDTPPLPPTTGSDPGKPVIITGAVLGGVGLVLGAVFAGVSKADADDAATKRAAMLAVGVTAACGPTPSAACQSAQSALQGRATFGNAAAWSFIAAGAVGAGTLVYALAAPRASKTSGVRAAPLVVANGGGVVLQGEW